MPITIKSTGMKYKNPDTGVYQGVDMLEEATIRDVIADVYSPTLPYAVGEYCLYNGELYCCTTAIPSGGETWNLAHWNKTNVTDELEDIKGAVDSIGSDDVANESNVTGATVSDALDNLSGAINDEIAERQTYVRPNLLDNWYFVGGGSQAGAGKFPINQRGLTSYSSGYGIDRWNAVNASYPIAIPNANGVTGNLRQFLEVERIKNSYTYTATLFSSKGIDSASAVLNSSVSGWQISAGGGTAWLGVRFDSGKWDVRITGTETFYAVKLELGDTQTLVHQENSSWILNEIPNYQEELVKCIGSHADSDDTYANNDYANLGSAISGKVSKNGDTMTGALTHKTSNYASGTAPTGSNKYATFFQLADSNNTNLVFFQGTSYTNGNEGFEITTRRNKNGTWIYNTLRLLLDSSFHSVVYLSSPGAWRTALGLSYATGDTESFTASCLCAALVTNNSKNIYFDFDLPKSLENISTVSVTTMNGAFRGATGGAATGYIDYWGNRNWVSVSGYTPSVSKLGSHRIRIALAKTTQYHYITDDKQTVGDAVPSNSMLTYWGTLSFSFS